MSPRAVAPRVPGLEDQEVQLAQDQQEYLETPALPVHFQDGSRGVLTRWRFTEEELELLRAGADLFLLTLTYGQPFQPVQLTAGFPDWAVGHGPPAVNEQQSAEDDRVRTNRARRKAEEEAALRSLEPGHLPLLEALTGGDLLALTTAQLEELSLDYVLRRNEQLGAELVAAVDGVEVGRRGGGLEVRVRWRNLEDSGTLDGCAYLVVHQASGALRTRCGLDGKTGTGDMVPTDKSVTCRRCNPHPGPDLSRS